MGYYINQINGKSLPARNKAQALINEGAVKIDEPIEFCENLVCVVENGPFDAAAYAFSKGEMKNFQIPSDYRLKTWLIVENAADLSDYNTNRNQYMNKEREALQKIELLSSHIEDDLVISLNNINDITIEALEQSEPRMYEIQYGDGLKTKIEVSDSGIKVIAAVDGWGISVEDNEITIQSLSLTNNPKQPTT